MRYLELREMPEMVSADNISDDTIWTVLGKARRVPQRADGKDGQFRFTIAEGFQNGETTILMWFLDEPIGYAMVHLATRHAVKGAAIRSTGLIPNYRRMGLAAKLYGHILKKGLPIWSDASWTPKGKRMWMSFAKTPGFAVYGFWKNPGARPERVTAADPDIWRAATLKELDFLLVAAEHDPFSNSSIAA